MKTPNELREEAGVLNLLGVMLASGVSFGDALLATANEFPNAETSVTTIHAKLMASGEQTSNWGEIRTVMSDTGYFSPFVPTLVQAGAYGELDSALLAGRMFLDRSAIMMQSSATADKINEVNFYRLLAILAGAGTPILEVFRVIAKSGVIPEEVTDELDAEVREGETITGAMKSFPERFSLRDCLAINIGEQTGALPEICGRLADLKELLLLRQMRPTVKELCDDRLLMQIIDYDHFSTLIDAGMPILRALDFFTKELGIPGRETMFKQLADSVRKGNTLSEAMAEHQDEFRPYMIRMVKAGEVSGELRNTFALIANFMRWQLLGIDLPLPLKVTETA